MCMCTFYLIIVNAREMSTSGFDQSTPLTAPNSNLSPREGRQHETMYEQGIRQHDVLFGLIPYEMISNSCYLPVYCVSNTPEHYIR